MYVRTTDSTGSSTGLDSPRTPPLAADAVTYEQGGDESSECWHDAAEDWMEDTDAAAVESVALPAQLQQLFATYRAGETAACKMLAALLCWMETTGTSLPQLEALLAAEEAAQTAQAAEHPAEPAAEAAAAAAAAAAACNSSRPSARRLTANLKLLLCSLSRMTGERSDGFNFRQVASGPLQLWYAHDTVRQLQLIRARCILEEPLEVSSGAAECVWLCVRVRV
jgi:hypothetical protein